MAKITKIFENEGVTAKKIADYGRRQGDNLHRRESGVWHPLENGRNPDIVSAYSPATGITLATEACREKSNEIKAIPLLIKKIDIAGKVVTADAMAMQKEIIDIIRKKGGDFLIELKANQRALRYGVEDRLKECTAVCSYTEGPEFGHGRIETRTYHIYDGLDIIADKAKWGSNMTIIEYEAHTITKSTGVSTTEKRLYVTSLQTDIPQLGRVVRRHWSIESMHWGLDRNLLQDKIKRKSIKSARNLDTIQRIVHSVFSIWKDCRKKLSDKRKGMAELMRSGAMISALHSWISTFCDFRRNAALPRRHTMTSRESHIPATPPSGTKSKSLPAAL